MQTRDLVVIIIIIFEFTVMLNNSVGKLTSPCLHNLFNYKLFISPVMWWLGSAEDNCLVSQAHEDFRDSISYYTLLRTVSLF